MLWSSGKDSALYLGSHELQFQPGDQLNISVKQEKKKRKSEKHHLLHRSAYYDGKENRFLYTKESVS